MRRAPELAFLPAVVEIAESPPSPASRVVALTIAAIVACGAGWAWLSVVDVVAVASGRTVPAGRIKTVQPLEIGVVREIHVRENQRVREGDVLVDLDPTTSAADRDRLARELTAVRLDVARLDALADGRVGSLAAVDHADHALVTQQRALLAAQREEYEARLAALDGEIARRQADHAAIQAIVTKLERIVPLARDREHSYGTLARQGFVARLTHVEVEQLLIEQEQELAAQRHRLDEAAALLDALTGQRRQVEGEHRRTTLLQLTDAQTRAVSLEQEVVKAERRHRLHRLTAPLDGVVQQLQVHTVGGVVTPAQALMTIVPATRALDVEALVLNRDAGFVRAGQSAEIKLETFPFTRYGTVSGRVAEVSADAIAHERLGLVYTARVSADRAVIDVDGRRVALVPGMSVTVEIKTGQRRVIDYLIAPLLRAASESFRER